MVLKCQMLISTTQRHKSNKFYKGLKNLILQQLLIKPATPQEGSQGEAPLLVLYSYLWQV